jgi:biotin synthase
MNKILSKNKPDKKEILNLLNSRGKERTSLFQHAADVKKMSIGNMVHLRGLIELSNICRKDCYYCGIRKSNTKISRYNLTDDEVISAALLADNYNYGSIVIQSGEVKNRSFTERIEKLIRQIKLKSNNRLGITLSLGEQDEETYRRWFEAGAHRYLLRIETANQDLYRKLHPMDDLHSFEKRIECLSILKNCGYQVGTGVMIGLPSQKTEDLADDLSFMQELDIDMCGMGPYIEHSETPLCQDKDHLLPIAERFDLTLKMIAILRIIMPEINIAATTALQAIDKIGREKAIMAGANIFMPNITPCQYRNDYLLYENKPCTLENAEDCMSCVDARIKLANSEIAYGEWGDSIHYKRKSFL